MANPRRPWGKTSVMGGWGIIESWPDGTTRTVAVVPDEADADRIVEGDELMAQMLDGSQQSVRLRTLLRQALDATKHSE